MTNAPEQKRFKILFLCTGNSARSILAEYFLRRLDPVHFEAFSAGANPKGRVNPHVLELLKDAYHIDDLMQSEQYLAISPDTVPEARNRGYKPCKHCIPSPRD